MTEVNFDLGLHTTRAIVQRIHGRAESKCVRRSHRHADARKQRLVDELDLVIEAIVEECRGDAGPATEQRLVKSEIKAATAFRTSRREMKLRNKLRRTLAQHRE